PGDHGAPRPGPVGGFQPGRQDAGPGGLRHDGQAVERGQWPEYDHPQRSPQPGQFRGVQPGPQGGGLGQPGRDGNDVAPDPGTLANFPPQVGQTYYFRVTGTATGPVWGTDVYTSDSPLAAAAVPAGALRPGETGIIRVQVVAGLSGYAGST